ncbi:MAG: hypothetical protein J6K72_03055 [Clostridia bacterium]|nr:hypothetical protein [Clostridia bacterium]
MMRKKEQQAPEFPVASIPFDDRINEQADLQELNITLIQQYLRETNNALYHDAGNMDFYSLCRQLDLVGEAHDCMYPKNIGLLFFCLEPDKHFPNAQIDVIHFSDASGEEPSIKETFSGPLPHQLRAALLYIRNSVITETIIKQPDVAEAKRYFNYSYEAIAEALAIAVCCKDYEIDGPIEVHILPDRIEIVSNYREEHHDNNEGIASEDISTESIENRRIYEFMKRLQLITKGNTDCQKRGMTVHGNPL